MRDVPASVSGAASGVVNASRQIGASVGLAVLGSLGATTTISNWHTAVHRFPVSIQATAAEQAQNVAGAHINAATAALGPTYRDAVAVGAADV